MAVVLTACPFTEPGAPDDLALELRRGIVERVFERTATGVASWSVEVDPINPLRLTVLPASAQRAESEAAVDDGALLRRRGRGGGRLHA